MDNYPEENPFDHETESETGSEDESEDELRANMDFNFGEVRLESDEDEEIHLDANVRHGCLWAI